MNSCTVLKSYFGRFVHLVEHQGLHRDWDPAGCKTCMSGRFLLVEQVFMWERVILSLWYNERACLLTYAATAATDIPITGT